MQSVVCAAGVPVVATVNAITTGGYVIRQHIAEPAYAPYAALLGGTTFRAGDLYGVLGIAFSLPNTADIGTSDYLRNMEVGLAKLPKILMSLPAWFITVHILHLRVGPLYRMTAFCEEAVEKDTYGLIVVITHCYYCHSHYQ
jgi:hypothetical protein